MDMVITDYKLEYGLMTWEQRHRIVREVEEKGSSTLLVDCDYGCECGGLAKFPFNISPRSLVKTNRTIQIISRYESGPKAIFRITRIDLVVKGSPALGCAERFFELTVEKPKK